MTKKLSLAALALVSACYLTACDDDSSSVAASADEPNSSASVTSSEDKADPESSATAPKSSASEETPASSASEEKPVIKAACDIDINSDKWEFEAVGKFMETFDGSAKAVTVFEGSTATITLNMSAEIGEFCEMAKANLKEKIASEVENLGEQETVDVECNENGELTMSAVKIENNVTEESKKEFHAEAVQACKNAQDGKLDGLLDGSADEESSSGSQSGDLLSCDMMVEMSVMGETYTSHSCGEAANTSENKKLLVDNCVSVEGLTTATLGTGCPGGAKKVCKDDVGGNVYFYDDDDAVKSCEELLTE